MPLSMSVGLLLSEWITFLLVSVPPRSHRTFIELLIGSMLNPEGWVTRAIGAIRREAHWTTYYKLIERASLSVPALAVRLLELVLSVRSQGRVEVVIDDSLVPRCSTQSPGTGIKHDHSKKANRPTFLNSQCWVTLALVVGVRLGSAVTVPIRSKLLIGRRQRGKLWVAKHLVKMVISHAPAIRLLTDAWYMRGRLLLPLLKEGVHITGQVRHDTALYARPDPEEPRRGRPRKYGVKIDLKARERLHCEEHTLPLYGKLQKVRLRSTIAVARFLKGQAVRAVWCEMEQSNGRWSRPRLILATETDLTPVEIVEAYGRRWGIEPLFHNLKRWWGINNLWQQKLKALELWMQIRSTAYTLTQLLALTLWESFPIMQIAPWRKGAIITAGLFAQWMRIQYTGLRFRRGYNKKSRKFTMPVPGTDQRLQC